MNRDDKTVFRIDRFSVPSDAEAEFLRAVFEINAFLQSMPGCIQLHVLKQQGSSPDINYMTIAQWLDSAAMQSARVAVAAKHEVMKLEPQEMLARLRIKAELGNYVPLLCSEHHWGIDIGRV